MNFGYSGVRVSSWEVKLGYSLGKCAVWVVWILFDIVKFG